MAWISRGRSKKPGRGEKVCDGGTARRAQVSNCTQPAGAEEEPEEEGNALCDRSCDSLSSWRASSRSFFDSVKLLRTSLGCRGEDEREDVSSLCSAGGEAAHPCPVARWVRQSKQDPSSHLSSPSILHSCARGRRDGRAQLRPPSTATARFRRRERGERTFEITPRTSPMPKKVRRAPCGLRAVSRAGRTATPTEVLTPAQARAVGRGCESARGEAESWRVGFMPRESSGRAMERSEGRTSQAAGSDREERTTSRGKTRDWTCAGSTRHATKASNAQGVNAVERASDTSEGGEDKTEARSNRENGRVRGREVGTEGGWAQPQSSRRDVVTTADAASERRESQGRSRGERRRKRGRKAHGQVPFWVNQDRRHSSWKPCSHTVSMQSSSSS